MHGDGMNRAGGSSGTTTTLRSRGKWQGNQANERNNEK